MVAIKKDFLLTTPPWGQPLFKRKRWVRFFLFRKLVWNVTQHPPKHVSNLRTEQLQLFRKSLCSRPHYSFSVNASSSPVIEETIQRRFFARSQNDMQLQRFLWCHQPTDSLRTTKSGLRWSTIRRTIRLLPTPLLCPMTAEKKSSTW